MKKPILVINSIEEIRSDIIIKERPKSVSFEYHLKVEGSGNFDDYVKDGIFDHQKLIDNIIKGKIKIISYDNI